MQIDCLFTQAAEHNKNILFLIHKEKSFIGKLEGAFRERCIRELKAFKLEIFKFFFNIFLLQFFRFLGNSLHSIQHVPRLSNRVSVKNGFKKS